MKDEELEALEHDLDAVSRRLANDRPWNPSAWRVRWLLHEPLHQFLWTLALISATLWLGLRNGHSWMIGVGLILLLLPGRIEKLREWRAELAGAGGDDLFELYRTQVDRRFGELFVGVFFDLAIVFGSLLFALILPDPRAILVVGGLFGLRAAQRGFVAIPRNLRESRAIRPAIDPGGSGDVDHDDGDDEGGGSLVLFVLYVIWSALVVFVFFAGPFVVLTAAIVALLAEEPGGPWTLAAGVAVAWLAVLAWRRIADDDEEDDDDEDVGQAEHREERS